MRTFHRFGVIGLLLLGLAGEGPGRAEGLSACADRLAAQPRERGPVQCLYEEWRRPGQAGAARRRMEELLASYPQSAWLHLYLGHLDWSGQDLTAAERRYAEAIQLFAAQGPPRGEVESRYALYLLRVFQGRQDDAGEQVRQVARVARASGEPRLIASAQILEARHLFSRSDDLPRAHALLRRAQAQLGPEGAFDLRRDCLQLLGNIDLELGRYREAASAFRQLADLARRKGDGQYEVSARYGLVRVRIEEEAEVPGHPDRAATLAALDELLAAAERAGSRGVEHRARWLLTRLAQGPEARRHHERCLAAASEPAEPSSCWSAWARRAARHDPAEAQEAAGRALRLAMEAGDRLAMVQARREQMRASWAAGAADRMAVARAALSAIEAFRDAQGSEGEAAFFSSWADDYHWLSGRLLGEARPDLAQAFAITERMRARALLGALEAAQAEPLAERPRQPASLAQIQASLADDTALLSFQIAPWRSWDDDFGGGSWLLAVTRQGSRLYRLETDRVGLRPAVETLAGLFPRRDGGEARPAAHLYRQVFGTALADLPPGIRRLVVVPDDVLHRLPFAALRPEPDTPPLAARYEISVAPSATLWRRWRLSPVRRNSGAALALADPPALDRSPARRLAPLPQARREGRAAVRALGGESRLRTGEEASEAFLKTGAARGFAVLHLATHALVDETRPERSGVVLAPGSPSEDGFLQIGEIAGLDLSGQAVVLSSCRSAAGPVLRGEGVMGLARAFFQAGAPAVVASLWPLRDDDAALLFARFYHHLGRGASVAAALQAAQRDRAAAGAPAEAWAGVVVLGNGDLVPVPGGHLRLGPAAWTILAGALALALALLARRRLRPR